MMKIAEAFNNPDHKLDDRVDRSNHGWLVALLTVVKLVKRWENLRKN